MVWQEIFDERFQGNYPRCVWILPKLNEPKLGFFIVSLENNIQVEAGTEGISMPNRASGFCFAGRIFLNRKRKRIENDVVNKIAYRICFFIKKIFTFEK
jgi:hypothetical protein